MARTLHRRVAGQPRSVHDADVYTRLGHITADLARVRHELAATRAQLSDEQKLTRRLRNALALAPFAQRASLWLSLLH